MSATPKSREDEVFQRLAHEGLQALLTAAQRLRRTLTPARLRKVHPEVEAHAKAFDAAVVRYVSLTREYSAN